MPWYTPSPTEFSSFLTASLSCSYEMLAAAPKQDGRGLEEEDAIERKMIYKEEERRLVSLFEDDGR